MDKHIELTIEDLINLQQAPKHQIMKDLWSRMSAMVKDQDTEAEDSQDSDSSASDEPAAEPPSEKS